MGPLAPLAEAQMPPAQPLLALVFVNRTGVERLERLGRGPVFENPAASLVDGGPPSLGRRQFSAVAVQKPEALPTMVPLPAGCDDAAPKRDVVGQARYSGGYSWASSQLKPPVFSVSVLNHQLVCLSALAAHHFRRDWLHLDSSCQNRLCIRVPCRCINTAELPLRHALEPTDRRLQQERCPASI